MWPPMEKAGGVPCSRISSPFPATLPSLAREEAVLTSAYGKGPQRELRASLAGASSAPSLFLRAGLVTG